MLPLIILLPQRNFLHLRTVASGLQQLKAVLKDALAISDATSVEIYHENWTLVSNEEYTYLSPHTTLLAVTVTNQNTSLQQFSQYQPTPPPPLHHQPDESRHGNSEHPLIITNIRGYASLPPSNPNPPSKISPLHRLRCPPIRFNSPVSNLQCQFGARQQDHVITGAPPPYSYVRAPAGTERVRAIYMHPVRGVPPHLQRPNVCLVTRQHCIDSPQSQQKRSVPPLYHVPHLPLWHNVTVPSMAMHNPANCYANVVENGVPVNYQSHTPQGIDMMSPPNKGATPTPQLQTTTYSVAQQPVPVMVRLSEPAYHLPKDWNSNPVKEPCTEEVVPCDTEDTKEAPPSDTEEWSLCVDPDSPALSIAAVPIHAPDASMIPEVVPTASTLNEDSMEDTTLSVDQCKDTMPDNCKDTLVASETAFQPLILSSSDQCKGTVPPFMDNCKETLVASGTVCQPLSISSSSDQFVHMCSQVLAKKLPFEDFCCELESAAQQQQVVSQPHFVDKFDADQGLLLEVKSEVDVAFKEGLCLKSEVDLLNLKEESQLIPYKSETGKEGSLFGVSKAEVEKEPLGLHPDLDNHRICKSSEEASTLGDRHDYLSSLCKDHVPSMSSSLSTVDQSCHFIIKLPLKYYLEKAPRRKQVLRRRTLQRRKRSKPLNVQIPLAKLNDVQQLAAMRQATLPIVTVPSQHVRKTIQVTSCTTVIPLKQSDKVSAYDSHNHAIKDSNCSYPCDPKTLPVPSGVDRLSPNDQCGSRTVAKTLLQEQWEEVLEHCEQLGPRQQKELMDIMTGRTKGDGVLDTRRFVLKSLPKQQLVCLEVDLKNRTWTPFKVEAPPEFRTSLIQP